MIDSCRPFFLFFGFSLVLFLLTRPFGLSIYRASIFRCAKPPIAISFPQLFAGAWRHNQPGLKSGRSRSFEGHEEFVRYQAVQMRPFSQSSEWKRQVTKSIVEPEDRAKWKQVTRLQVPAAYVLWHFLQVWLIVFLEGQVPDRFPSQSCCWEIWRKHCLFSSHVY